MLSTKHNFLFIHVPKTGGNSIQKLLVEHSDDRITQTKNHHNGEDWFGIDNHQYAYRKHSRNIDYQRLVPADVYDQLFRFAVIRNPWDWCVSWYLHRNKRAFTEENFRDFIRQMPLLRDYIGTPPGIVQICNRGLARMHTPIRWRIGRLDANVERLLRFESLQEEMVQLMQTLKLKVELLPHVNKTPRSHYSTYYSPYTKALVGRKFAEEIEFGKYLFEHE